MGRIAPHAPLMEITITGLVANSMLRGLDRTDICQMSVVSASLLAVHAELQQRRHQFQEHQCCWMPSADGGVKDFLAPRAIVASIFDAPRSWKLYNDEQNWLAC